MAIQQQLIDEFEILLRYNLATTYEGIKVHHDARPALRYATARLFDKGLITQQDGGYLTDLGHEVAEHIQSATAILQSETVTT